MVKLIKNQPKVKVTPGEEVETDLHLPKHLFKMPGEVGKDKATADADKPIVLTKKDMVAGIKQLKEITEAEEKAFMDLRAPDLKVEYEKIVAEAKATADAE